MSNSGRDTSTYVAFFVYTPIDTTKSKHRDYTVHCRQLLIIIIIKRLKGHVIAVDVAPSQSYEASLTIRDHTVLSTTFHK